MRAKLTRRARRGLADDTPDSRMVATPPDSSTSPVGLALTVAGAYGLYLIGLDPGRMSTLGTLATVGGLAYNLFGKTK